jgi:predicted glycogen debranching enzyme
MREWITTNGLGGYASLTYDNQASRKYHGLLISSLHPPTQRWNFISNVIDTFFFNDKIYTLNGRKGEFTFDYFPCFTYTLDDVTIKKSIYMPQEQNTTILTYDITTHHPVTCTHRPFINSRHIYSVSQHSSFNTHHNTCTHGISIKPNNTSKIIKIIMRDFTFTLKDKWIENHYQKDKERNDTYQDFTYSPGEFNREIQGSTMYHLILTLEDEIKSDITALYQQEIQRKKNLIQQAQLPSTHEKLVLSADNFIVKKDTKKSIVAGYHWFGDWGRDTLISLPGLCLVTKRFENAKDILLSFSQHQKNGLIPNVFMEKDSQPAYNTVDASLWYIDRIYQYLKYTNDKEVLHTLWPTLENIINGYKNGTDFNIHMDDDYLIHHGSGLTWMDVKLGDYYPTPRSNKAVEIQALWYNALRIMGKLSDIVQRDNIYDSLSENVKDSFLQQYDKQYDVIDAKDTSCRPNKIFLVSLDYSMITPSMKNAIVQDVQNHLLTPFGLRTLSPDDSQYKGHYLGFHHRDLAYHNGTVWPWLLGSFITAFIKTKKYEEEWRKYAYDTFLSPMFSIFGKQWDGSIHEIFDGNPIFAPRGCITQAWSIAEILRSWSEDIEKRRPSYETMFSSSEICI